MAGRHRSSGRGRRGQPAGRHRKGTRFYTGTSVKEHKRSSNPLSGIFDRLRPSWTPPGGWPQPGPVGARGKVDVWGGTVVRYPGTVHRSRSHATARLFGDWT